MISLNKANGSRFSHKLETLFWWILRILPLIVFIVYCFGASRSEGLWSFVVDDGGDMMAARYVSFENVLSETLSFYPSDFFVDLFLAVFGADGVFPMTRFSYFSIFSYLSYCVCIEILRLMYHVVVFIPRLASKWISAAVQDD